MDSVIKDITDLSISATDHVAVHNNLETCTSNILHPHGSDLKTLQTQQHINQHAQANKRDSANLLEGVETREGNPVKCVKFPTNSNEDERMASTNGGIRQEAADNAPPSSSTRASPAQAETHEYNKAKKVPNIRASLVNFFTSAEIEQHIASLKQECDQSKARSGKIPAQGQCSKAKVVRLCQLCESEAIAFAPQAYYCAGCGKPIKKPSPFWTMRSDGTNLYVCKSCLDACKGDTIELEGESHNLSLLAAGQYLKEQNEPWVRCDKCRKWQHEVCALFNTHLNEGGRAQYTCPMCWIKIKEDDSICCTSSAAHEAKDLPRTLLSDYIERHLAKRLECEKCERAQVQGLDLDEVPVANPLVVRVVSSADKKLEVKEKFLKTFNEDGYPKEFSYESKMLLLFQKIEAVDVCLFGMYVHEFGSECPLPNQRHIYIAYVDSINYFRPEVKTASGESLRTFVYHEFIIGYLDFCKNRGFTRCYIWVCPPVDSGQDYIFNCHPQSQKTPKSDQLQNWYMTMLDKAASKKIITEKLYLYEHFFTSTNESKANITATRLPYFDGDYISIKAEQILMELEREEAEEIHEGKERTRIGTAVTRSKDSDLMERLGREVVRHQKSYVLVHLQPICRHCCEFISSGSCRSCKVCENFIICDRCCNVQEKLDISQRHPSNEMIEHQLFPITTSTLGDTVLVDKVVQNEFFDTREIFLSICQNNHYQFDTLRKAKYSSTMLLHHLQNPAASTSLVLRKDTKEKRESLKTFIVVILLKHTFQCASNACEHADKCQQLKKLFRHEPHCKRKTEGKCKKCKYIWSLLQFHARVCKDEDCNVYHCSEYKIKLKRRAELRHRADISERVRSQEEDSGQNVSPLECGSTC